MPDETPRSSHAITALRLVAIPADQPVEDVTVTAVGKSDGDIESVMITTVDGLRIETFTKPGIRHGPHGLITSDLRLEDAAAGVVISALLEGIPPGEPRDTARSRAEAVMEEGRRLGDQVWKPAVWTMRSVSIDGETFVLFATALTDVVAAVADIGAARLMIWGPRIADDIALQLVPLSALPRTVSY